MKVCARDLGRMDYQACWQMQQLLFDELLIRKTAGTTTGAHTGHETSAATPPPKCGTERAHSEDAQEVGTILLVEHPPVFTLGKSGHADNLLVDLSALEAAGAQFFHIDRGGDITFHGPGQLVCYPILDLERIGIGLREYIEALEEAVIRTVATYGIAAGRIDGASGVWITGACGAKTEEGKPDAKTAVGKPGAKTEKGTSGETIGTFPRKICAIGVRASRYVTMHGFALNVSTDLGWFSRINPCGFTDRGVTSIERETGCEVPMESVKALVLQFLGEILNVRIYNN